MTEISRVGKVWIYTTVSTHSRQQDIDRQILASFFGQLVRGSTRFTLLRVGPRGGGQWVAMLMLPRFLPWYDTHCRASVSAQNYSSSLSTAEVNVALGLFWFWTWMLAIAQLAVLTSQLAEVSCIRKQLFLPPRSRRLPRV